MCYRKQNLLYPADKLGPLTKHHRRPKSKAGKDTEENISHIPQKLHEAYHLLFANNSVNRISEILNDHFIDPDYFMVPVPRDFLDVIYKILKNEKAYR